MGFRLVVFDMAGTTVQDQGFVAEALIAALRAADCEVTFPQAQALMGYSKPEAIRQLLLKADQNAEEERVRSVHTDFVERMLDTYRNDPRVTPIDGTEETFGALHRAGVRVALDTAFSREIADVIVARLGWKERGLVDALIATDEVSEGRPAPHMIHSLMAQLDIDDARAVIKVGDTEVDIREGRSAACGLVVAVTTGAYSRAALAAHMPDQIIDHLSELLPLIHAGNTV